MYIFSKKEILFVFLLISKGVQPQQINLGSLSLTRNPFTGDIIFGLNQGANIFGFGADRQFGLNIGPRRFGAINDNGLLFGNQRFGINSQLGYDNERGLDFGSFLNIFQPIGQSYQNCQKHSIANQEGANPAINEINNQEYTPFSIVTVDDKKFPPSIGDGWNSEEIIKKNEYPKVTLKKN